MFRHLVQRKVAIYQSGDLRQDCDRPSSASKRVLDFRPHREGYRRKDMERETVGPKGALTKVRVQSLPNALLLRFFLRKSPAFKGMRNTVAVSGSACAEWLHFVGTLIQLSRQYGGSVPAGPSRARILRKGG